MFFAAFDLPSAPASAGISWPDVSLSFFAIVLEGAPFLLLGAIISGLVDVFLPAGVIKDWLPRSKTQGVFAAIGAGLIFPLCECGAMPIVQRLIRKGVPPAVATTYMLAAPGLNPLAMFSTFLAFRNQDPWLMVVLRFGFSFLVLLFLGFWLVRLRPDQMLRAETFIRNLLAPIGQNPFLGPLAGILLAQLLCLCSTTDAFIIAAFAPFSVSAKIAFLVAGPLIDLKLYWLYRSAFQARFVHALWMRALAATFLLTLLYSLKP